MDTNNHAMDFLRRKDGEGQFPTHQYREFQKGYSDAQGKWDDAKGKAMSNPSHSKLDRERC